MKFHRPWFLIAAEGTTAAATLPMILKILCISLHIARVLRAHGDVMRNNEFQPCRSLRRTIKIKATPINKNMAPSPVRA